MDDIKHKLAMAIEALEWIADGNDYYAMKVCAREAIKIINLEVPCPRCGEPLDAATAEVIGFGDCCDGH